jgi:hypothetical protein
MAQAITLRPKLQMSALVLYRWPEGIRSSEITYQYGYWPQASEAEVGTDLECAPGTCTPLSRQRS